MDNMELDISFVIERGFGEVRKDLRIPEWMTEYEAESQIVSSGHGWKYLVLPAMVGAGERRHWVKIAGKIVEESCRAPKDSKRGLGVMAKRQVLYTLGVPKLFCNDHDSGRTGGGGCRILPGVWAGSGFPWCSKCEKQAKARSAPSA